MFIDDNIDMRTLLKYKFSRGCEQMKTLIKGGWVVDPFQDIDEPMDILVSDGRIEALEKNILAEDHEIIDASGYHVVPGLIDIHVHFREPGFEYKETIKTGSMAAVAGGFTTVVCMPNTNPVIDSLETVEYIKEKAKEAACNIYMMGSITQGLDGEVLSNYGALKKSGILGLTDDGKTVMNSRVMLEAMEMAKDLDLLVSVHCEDTNLVYDRSINRGSVSEKLNLEGIPAAAEELIIQRDIFLAEKTGARLHIQHISTKKGLELVSEAKNKGLSVTCEASPHHFTLSQEDVLELKTIAKMSPPLRTKEDMEAIKRGLLVGTIDVIATDHAPHSVEDKDKNIVEAANGIVGLETALGLTMSELVHDRGMSMTDLVRLMSYNPAKLVDIPKGTLKVGYDADITILDKDKVWTVDCSSFQSKAMNTPFDGRQLRGKAMVTMVAGVVKYRD